MSKVRAWRIALVALAALLVAACGLKGDLTIPTEEPKAAPDDTESTDDEAPDTSSGTSPGQTP